MKVIRHDDNSFPSEDEQRRLKAAFAAQRVSLICATATAYQQPDLRSFTFPGTKIMASRLEVREFVERVSKKRGDNQELAKTCLLVWGQPPLVGKEITFLEALYRLKDPRT